MELLMPRFLDDPFRQGGNIAYNSFWPGLMIFAAPKMCGMGEGIGKKNAGRGMLLKNAALSLKWKDSLEPL